MTVFVDTSALYAFIDVTDAEHVHARELWRRALTEHASLITTNYVVTESASLLQRRVGLSALHVLQQMLTEVHILWVDAALHDQAMRGLLLLNRRKLSLVDCVSFAAMRDVGAEVAFAFDQHFAEHGFRLLA